MLRRLVAVFPLLFICISANIVNAVHWLFIGTDCSDDVLRAQPIIDKISGWAEKRNETPKDESDDEPEFI